MRIAFKEWAVVVDALARGDQILILRKGGVSEGPGGFQLEHERFLLFPTLFHQQRESVIAHSQIRYDAIAPKLSPAIVRVECFAEVVDWKLVESAAAAASLHGQHIWRAEVVREKFLSGRGNSMYALALRVFRLGTPAELPLLAHYGGCKSWVELDHPISASGAQPVLTDSEFNLKLERFEQALASAEVRL